MVYNFTDEVQVINYVKDNFLGDFSDFFLGLIIFFLFIGILKIFVSVFSR